jgi:hypothetical protein
MILGACWSPLSVVWQLQLTSRGKPPLRLPFGTNFRFGKRNGANSLTVCRKLERQLPMQRVSAGLPLAMRRCPLQLWIGTKAGAGEIYGLKVTERELGAISYFPKDRKNRDEKT